MHMAREQNARFWQDLSLGNIGIAMVGQARYDSAFELIANDLAMSLKNHEWRSAAVDYVYLGEILDHQHAIAKAQHYFDSAYALMTRERITLLYFFHKAAEHYRYREDYRKSQEYLARYLSLRDSMHIQKNSKRLIMAQLRNEFDKKQLEVELVTKDNELKNVQLKNHRITLAVTLVAIAVAGMLVLRLYRSNVDEKRVTRMLEEKVRKRTWRLAKVNRELDTFIYRSSHDLRRPLTTLLGLDNLGQLTVKDEAARQLLQKVGETARGMDHMLTKLRYIHELNLRTRKLVECNLTAIVLEELEKVQIELTKNNIAVSTSLAFHQQLKTDAGIVRLIVSNLLENAIQFRHPRVPNHIHLNTGILEGNYCYVEVADTGIGIDKGIMERIYTPFFRGSEYSHGSGLGLFLVKNGVEALKGKIFLESESGKGARFTVAIPTDV
jgi:signal transduction histidine kinase